MSEVERAIAAYLDGGDRAGFGTRDPFRRFTGGGGAEGVAKALALSVKDVDDCPDDDTRYSAQLFGMIVGAAKIEATDRTMIQIFMEVAYEDNVSDFNKGLQRSKQETHDATRRTIGAHGGKIPTAAEAAAVFEEKGMSWQEVVVVSSVLYNGTVPTLGEIELEGYGSDPGQWASAKEQRKQQKTNIHICLKNKDAAAYRSMISKGATRMANNGLWSTGAAGVMLFVSKLSAMTFDQGMPELFLAYAEEHHEIYKGKGLCSRLNPLDSAILTETVIAIKNQTRTQDAKLDKVLEAVETQSVQLEHKLKSRMGDLSSALSRLSDLERAAKTETQKKGPPSADNRCSYCQSTEHFVRDCPKKAEADAKKKKEAEENANK